MFVCSACRPSNPNTSTVKVNPSLFKGSGKENTNEQQLQANDKQQRLETFARKQREREAAEKAEQEKRLARVKVAARERQQREAERRAEELQRQKAEEEREEELRRQQAAREAERHQEEEQKRQEEEAQRQRQEEKAASDSAKLKSFLKSKRYGENVNGKRKTLRKHYYPLHDAVATGDVELVRVLLAAGADPSLRSSSGKTALARAVKSNVDGSLDDICEVLTAATSALPPSPKEVAQQSRARLGDARL